MSNHLTTTRRRYAVLPSVVLVVLAVAFLLVSAARAEDPPIVSAGPVTAGGNTASGDVGSDGKADACLNDQRSEADPNSADADSAVKLNQGSCQASSGSSAGSGSSSGSGSSAGKQSSAGSGSKSPTSTRGSSGSRRSGAASAGSVAAGNAIGLRIAGVRPSTKGVSARKRFRVLVTLKDLRGRFVRDAIVSVGKAPGARNTVSGTCSTFSNRLGQANVLVHVDKRALGTRLILRISARTPKARAVTLRSVRLPAAGKRSM